MILWLVTLRLIVRKYWRRISSARFYWAVVTCLRTHRLILIGFIRSWRGVPSLRILVLIRVLLMLRSLWIFWRLICILLSRNSILLIRIKPSHRFQKSSKPKLPKDKMLSKERKRCLSWKSDGKILRKRFIDLLHPINII